MRTLGHDNSKVIQDFLRLLGREPFRGKVSAQVEPPITAAGGLNSH